MPVKNMPSKVPAPPIDATGAEAAHLIEVGEISTDQRAEIASAIGSGADATVLPRRPEQA
jgi:hypothetical protein